VAIRRSTRSVGEKRIRTLVRRLLEASTLCAIATVTPAGRAHVNTAYFAWTPELSVVWLSEPGATHSRNVRANPSVAVAVYDSTQSWGKPDRGIQLFGSAVELSDEPAAREPERAYARRFPEYGESRLGAYRLYALRPRRLKLFDEPALGAATFVTARVDRSGRITWERTDIYEPRA
jgi:uncharacterized protein YhbP (UPF0306 family)